MDDAKLSAILQSSKVISEANLAQAVNFARERKISLYDALLDQDLISDQALGMLIADGLKVSYVNLQKVTIDGAVLNLIPQIVAKSHYLIAFAKERQGLKLAMFDPTNLEQIEFIKKKVGVDVIVSFATKRDIENTIRLYNKDLKKSFEEIIASSIKEAHENLNKEPPIAALVNTLIEYAYQNKASDIHLEPSEKDTKVRLRIDGVLHDVVVIPKNLEEQVISRIKVLANLRTDEHLRAQDGKMKFKTEAEDLDLRVSVVPIINGEKTVLRLLSERTRQFGLEMLGMNDRNLGLVKKNIAKPYGMVLAAGPTGCGKTTTIYAILKILNTRDKNIATIEDPVEYDIEGVNQIQVNPKTNLTFADGLKSILRQDPDIIFIGEIRDSETAKIAVNSAMTGHLVLSTIHTNDAATTLPRLLDMEVEPFLVASTVNVIVAQRLVRQICTRCVKSEEITTDKLASKFGQTLIFDHFGNKEKIRISKGVGCLVCHYSGFVGRIGIFEVLEIAPALRKLINAVTDADTIKNEAVKLGMTTMVKDGFTKVEQGITTVEEVLRVMKS